MSRTLRPISCAVGALAFSIACGGTSSSSNGSTNPGGNPSGGNNTTPSTVEITPPGSVTLDALQATQSVSASAKNSSGAAVSATLTWSSDAPSIATVPSAGGTVTAVANGTAHITAKTDNGVSSTLTVLVQQKATQLSRISGDGQQGTVNTVLGSPLAVSATDRNNNVVSGTAVTFATTTGTLATPNATTGADGRASSTWTLPTAAGAAAATAALASDATKSVSFAATAAPGAAVRLVKGGGDGQRASVNTLLPTQLTATAVDQFNNGVPNVNVLFVVTSGGGSLNSFGGSTNPNGQTVVAWTLGADSVSDQLTQASNASLTGSPITFTAAGIRMSMDGLGPSPFKTGCHVSATIRGITAADLPNVSVTFDGVPAASITLTNISGKTGTLTAAAPAISKASGTTIPVLIKAYSQTIAQSLVYNTTASCS